MLILKFFKKHFILYTHTIHFILYNTYYTHNCSPTFKDFGVKIIHIIINNLISNRVIIDFAAS